MPANSFPESAYTIVDRAPVVREKSYLYVDGGGNVAVFDRRGFDRRPL